MSQGFGLTWRQVNDDNLDFWANYPFKSVICKVIQKKKKNQSCIYNLINVIKKSVKVCAKKEIADCKYRTKEKYFTSCY